MAISQLATQIESSPKGELFQSVEFVSNLIDLDAVSVSQLLGRDYLFIQSDAFEQPPGNHPATYSQFEMLIRQLELAQTHTVVVTVETESAGESFTRHDLTWYKGKICRVESTPIAHQDQLEFINMIWQCSTSAVPT
jgi:hypothetical protein